LIHCPCEVDGKYFENTRIAHRLAFPRNDVSYFQLSRALKRGKRELFGHKISRVERRYEIAPADDDGADLIPVPASVSPIKEHRRGEGPLLCYPPGESPLERGLQRWH
jgi:hypothetical protein